MAFKVATKFKTKANRTSASSQVDRVRFPLAKSEEIYETLTKFRSVWGEKQTLDKLGPSNRRSLVSRTWVSLCDVSDPPSVALIREFYSNLSVHSEDTDGHYLSTWIRGKEFRITKHLVSEALGVPMVRKPTYPYTEFPSIDDIMSSLCGRSVT